MNGDCLGRKELFAGVKGIIFDYGGTIDTNSVHWSEVLWQAYCEEQVPVSKEQFRECYVYGERTLARQYLIRPEHSFADMLLIKVDLETQYLVEKGYWSVAPSERQMVVEAVSRRCNDAVLEVLSHNRPLIDALAEKYPLALVSNFYGNIKTVLNTFALNSFSHIIESAIVGVRKPDPRIFRLGVVALGLQPNEVAVVGDSFAKDIVPANSIGCKTVWFKGIGWGNEQTDEQLPTAVITSFSELSSLFL